MASWAASRAASSISLRPASARPSLARTAPAWAIARVRSGWFSPRARTAASSANSMAFLGSVSANRSASACKTGWLPESSFWFNSASAPVASVSASSAACGLADPVVVADGRAAADHSRARSGSIAAMSRMHRNAPLLFAFAPYFSQIRIKTCLAKARCSS